MRGEGAPLLLFWLLPPLLCAACASLGAQPGRCPVALVPSEALPDGLFLRSRMHMGTQGHASRFEIAAVVERGELVVVGVAPFGIQLFAIRQVGRKHWSEHRLAGMAPPSAWVLDALHRIYWIAPPSYGGGEAQRSWDREGERVTDAFTGGRLRHREFARLEGNGGQRESTRVWIDYPDVGNAEEPPEIAIHNPWCGYEGRLVPLEPMPDSAASAGEWTLR